MCSCVCMGVCASMSLQNTININDNVSVTNICGYVLLIMQTATCIISILPKQTYQRYVMYHREGLFMRKEHVPFFSQVYNIMERIEIRKCILWDVCTFTRRGRFSRFVKEALKVNIINFHSLVVVLKCTKLLCLLSSFSW